MANIDASFEGIAGLQSAPEQLVPLGAEYPIFNELVDWEKDALFTTVPELFKHAHSISKDKAFLGKRVNGQFQFETYDEVYKQILCFASALISIGLKPGDRVANFSNNRPEWPKTDYGCAFSACVHVPMYPTLSKKELEYIVRDCGAKCIVVGTAEHLRKLISIENECPELEHIIAITPTGDPSTKHVWSWDEFIEYGKVRLRRNQAHIDYLSKSLRAWDVASLVYTSGTTGDPKGVMLMHGNFASQALCLKDYLNARRDDVELCFLPLSHVFERLVNYLYTSVGGSIAYAQGIHTVMQDLVDLKPTIFPTVPLLLHKMYDRVMDNPDLKKAPSLKWAIKVGRSYSAAKRAGRVSRILQAQQSMAMSLIGNGIRKRFGGNIRCVVSGGAPLRLDVANFFSDIGVKIIEGYGLTETSPVISVNPFEDPHPGTVGKCLPLVNVKIDDGEIVARGPNIMRGYYRHPAATVATLDAAGWFHTGDIGHLDEHDYLHITDRKKCMIVLANGKNVAPAGIEQLLCRSKWISRAVLVGDNAQYIAALIVPDMERLKAWAEGKGLEGGTAEWVENEEFKSLLNGEVRELCQHLSNYEKVKRIAILPHDFSQEAGELTPTMKVKHRVIEENYASIINTLLNKE